MSNIEVIHISIVIIYYVLMYRFKLKGNRCIYILPCVMASYIGFSFVEGASGGFLSSEDDFISRCCYAWSLTFLATGFSYYAILGRGE
jgi:hypothetical protein